MRHATSGRRSRNRNNGGNGSSSNNGNRRGNQNRMQVFDSNGPEVRIRGTAYQICEKYMALAKDAASSGDSIVAESYLQHAEHYQRLINSWQAENPGYQPETNTYAPDNQQPAEDDLSLPVSILGPKVNLESQTSSDASQDQNVLEEA
jgi:hypothetical protein